MENTLDFIILFTLICIRLTHYDHVFDVTPDFVAFAQDKWLIDEFRLSVGNTCLPFLLISAVFKQLKHVSDRKYSQTLTRKTQAHPAKKQTLLGVIHRHTSKAVNHGIVRLKHWQGSCRPIWVHLQSNTGQYCHRGGQPSNKIKVSYAKAIPTGDLP